MLLVLLNMYLCILDADACYQLLFVIGLSKFNSNTSGADLGLSVVSLLIALFKCILLKSYKCTRCTGFCPEPWLCKKVCKKFSEFEVTDLLWTCLDPSIKLVLGFCNSICHWPMCVNYSGLRCIITINAGCLVNRLVAAGHCIYACEYIVSTGQFMDALIFIYG